MSPEQRRIASSILSGKLPIDSLPMDDPREPYPDSQPDRPERGKVYALSGIAAGKSWAESEVEPESAPDPALVHLRHARSAIDSGFFLEADRLARLAAAAGVDAQVARDFLGAHRLRLMNDWKQSGGAS